MNCPFPDRWSILVNTTENTTHNTELNYLRKIICLRQSEGSVGRISICNVIENLAEHGINCYSHDVTLMSTVTAMASY